MAGPDAMSRKYEINIPLAPVIAPMSVDIQSIRAKRSVTILAVAAGVTRAAAISNTPRTLMVARIVEASTKEKIASSLAVAMPEIAATSGSKVANISAR